MYQSKVTPASLSLKGKVTKHTTVKWTILLVGLPHTAFTALITQAIKVRKSCCFSLPSFFQETPLSPNYMDTAMLRTPGADSLMFQTPGRPDSAAYPGSTQPGKRPNSVTFQFPESTGRTFRQGMDTNVSLSTWGSDFSPTTYGVTTPVSLVTTLII